MSIIVYDLPSENIQKIRNSIFYDKVRNVRVNCVRKLHHLGIQCTESVILLSTDSISNITNAIEIIKQKYQNLRDEILNVLGYDIGEPIIKVLGISQEQYEIFRRISERYLLDMIDQNIDRVSMIINNNNHENIQKILRSLKRIKKEWLKIKYHCVKLQINVIKDLDYLLSLVDQAIERLTR